MSLLDGRPPAVDVRFRPGNTFTCTFQWPAGTLVGRTFTAVLDATTLTANVAGDNLVVSMSEAQTLAAANVGEFTLTETTGGASDVVIVGSWHSSNGPSAGETNVVSVNESAGVVSVIAQATSGVVGNLTVAGNLVVPDPAAGASSAVSLGEATSVAQALVDALPNLANGNRTTIDSGVPGEVSVDLASEVPSVFAPAPGTVSNTTTETTMTTVAVPALVATSSVVWLLSGSLTNNTGGATTTTVRVKGNGVTYWTITLSAVATSASARQLWASLPGQVSDFGGLRLFGSGRWALSNAGAETIAVDALPAAATFAGTLPAGAHNWTVTCQHGTASTNLGLTLNVTQLVLKP